MGISGFFREHFGSVLFGLAVVLACAYFTFAATRGPWGLYEKGRIEAREQILEAELAGLTVRRQMAENRVRRMSDTYLDLDLLDEQARRLIGMARNDEIIIR